MSATYHNPWMPADALRILEQERGRILDVGGGAAPFWRAEHIIDIQPYDADRLERNAWGYGENGESRKSKTEIQATEDESDVKGWKHENYTQFDLCACEKWPFPDKAFDLGLSSHCLEDIRDPVQVVGEMARCCKRVLIICPSRLLEQMRGVDHPRYCGMPHHMWLVSEADGVIEFRRKTQIMEFPGLHLVCPLGKKLTTEAGSMYYLSKSPLAREVMYFDTQRDKQEYAEFVGCHSDLSGKLETDCRWRNWRLWIWYFRQKWCYAV